jgi:hypothetical protein
MHMKNFLHRCLAVSEKEIHALAGQSAGSKRSGSSVANLHDVRGFRGVDVGEIRRVSRWDDEQMPDVHGPDVHERRTAVVAIHEARGQLASKNAAEDAVAHS